MPDDYSTDSIVNSSSDISFDTSVDTNVDSLDLCDGEKIKVDDGSEKLLDSADDLSDDADDKKDLSDDISDIADDSTNDDIQSYASNKIEDVNEINDDDDLEKLPDSIEDNTFNDGHNSQSGKRLSNSNYLCDRQYLNPETTDRYTEQVDRMYPLSDGRARPNYGIDDRYSMNNQEGRKNSQENFDETFGDNAEKEYNNKNRDSVNSNNIDNNGSKELFGFRRKKWNQDHDFDDSNEVKELYDLGVKNVDLRQCNPEYRGEIVSAVKDMYERYPELKDQVQAIKCYKMDNDGTFASYGPTSEKTPYGGYLSLNSTHFGSDNFRDEINNLSSNGWFVPKSSPQGIVEHELGHGLHLDMCSRNNNLEYGKVPNSTDYDNAVQEYVDDIHATSIVDRACEDCGFGFYSRNTSNELSKYGSSNYGEAFAEAISETNNSDNPRRLSVAINNRYNEYKTKF